MESNLSRPELLDQFANWTGATLKDGRGMKLRPRQADEITASQEAARIRQLREAMPHVGIQLAVSPAVAELIREQLSVEELYGVEFL